MKHSSRIGFSFGLTSGIITTLGLITGLYFTNASRAIIIGGILTIALTDAFSDALGIHVAEESEEMHNLHEIWTATITTFLAKFLTASTFLIPFLWDKTFGFWVSVVWGTILIIAFSVYLSRHHKKSALTIIAEHLLISWLVIIAASLIGLFIRRTFNT